MKFSINQTAFIKGLNLVSKAAGISSSAPILNSVKISANNSDVELQATDLNLAIKHITPANVDESGDVLVSLRTLLSVVKTLPDAPVTIETSDTGISLTCQNSSFTLLTLNADEFPPFPEYQIENSVTLSCDLLSKMVERVYRVTSKDVTRPILNGILFTVNDNTVRLVAVDSHRLAVCDTNVETSSLAKEFSVVVPGQAFHDALSISAENNQISVAATDAHIVFSSSTTTFVSRKIEGSFPNYKQLLPQSSKTTIELPLEGFSEALKRVSSIVAQNPSVRFSIDTDNKLLTLNTMNTNTGQAKENLSLTCQGESLTIALNNHYVLEGISPLLSEKKEAVTLELQDSTQPAIFKSFSDINYLYLLMPIKI